jgi:hypothetical protein
MTMAASNGGEAWVPVAMRIWAQGGSCRAFQGSGRRGRISGRDQAHGGPGQLNGKPRVTGAGYSATIAGVIGDG